MAPRFSVMPTLKSKGQSTLPPIYSVVSSDVHGFECYEISTRKCLFVKYFHHVYFDPTKACLPFSLSPAVLAYLLSIYSIYKVRSTIAPMENYFYNYLKYNMIQLLGQSGKITNTKLPTPHAYSTAHAHMCVLNCHQTIKCVQCLLSACIPT